MNIFGPGFVHHFSISNTQRAINYTNSLRCHCNIFIYSTHVMRRKTRTRFFKYIIIRNALIACTSGIRFGPTHTHNTFIRHSNMCVRVRPCNPIMVVNGLWPKRAYHGLHGIRLYKYAFFEIRLPISDLLVSWALRFCSAMWCTFSKGHALS